MRRKDPPTVRYRGCGHTTRLIVGTRPNRTGHCHTDHCHTDQAFLDVTLLARSKPASLPLVSGRRLSSAGPPPRTGRSSRRSGRACMCTIAACIAMGVGQQVKGRADLEDGTWEVGMWRAGDAGVSGEE